MHGTSPTSSPGPRRTRPTTARVAGASFVTVPVPVVITTGADTSCRRASCPARPSPAAVLGFFVITLDAVVVNVALPSIRADLGGGITGLQWVVDGYTLMFAALAAVRRRAGGPDRRPPGVRRRARRVRRRVRRLRRWHPTLGVLVAARFVQGAGAAMMMPASMALIAPGLSRPGHAGPRGRGLGDGRRGRRRSPGPVLGGLLTPGQLAADLLRQRAGRRAHASRCWPGRARSPAPAGAVRLGRAGRRRCWRWAA